MSTPNNRRRDPGRTRLGQMMPWILIVLIVVVVGTVNLGVRVGYLLDPPAPELGDPFALVLQVASGQVAWPAAGTVVLAIVAGAVAFLIALAVRRKLRRRKASTRVDRQAQYMGRGRDIESLTKKASQATSKRLGAGDWPGVFIGQTVDHGLPLYASAEDQVAVIAGPRQGKSTSLVIPAICAAPGPCITTSNKRDVVDATRDVRAKVGPVFVFDPQDVAQEPPTWWWNPLSYVTDEVRAAKLAGHFAEGSREENTGAGDAHFDPSGKALLAAYFLAAAIMNRPITAVYTWLTKPNDEARVAVLRQAGYPLVADQLYGILTTPERERGSIFSTARRMAGCLTNRAIASWVTPQGDADPRVQFSPADLIAKNGTLYSLSIEGEGTAGPLVTALTVACIEEAEDLARRSPGGRLQIPLLGMLDEIANVCRWKQLPNLYSHFGSKGIILSAVLQSWAQGEEIWGKGGMAKLWSAANVRMYLGNNTEADGFLSNLSTLIGHYDRASSSLSTTHGQHTYSDQLSRERILDVDDLAALPKGRAVVLSAGNRAVLVRTVPWMVGEYAEAVKASIDVHDPKGEATLAEAARELETVTENLGPIPGVQAAA